MTTMLESQSRFATEDWEKNIVTGHVTTDMPSGDVTTVANSMDAPIAMGVAALANEAGEALPNDRTEVAPPHETFKTFPEPSLIDHHAVPVKQEKRPDAEYMVGINNSFFKHQEMLEKLMRVEA